LRRIALTFDPMSPVPPITTIFMSYLPARAGQLSRFATLCLGRPYFAGETPIRRKAALN